MNEILPTTRYRWQAGEGDNHPDCVALDGVTRPLGAWQNSRMPGFHFGCRAALHPHQTAVLTLGGVYPLRPEPPPRLLHYRLQNGQIVPAAGGAFPSATLPQARQRAGGT